MAMKHVLLISTLFFCFTAPLSAMAQPIESEPLAPMDLQSPQTQAAPSSGPQPYYNRVVETNSTEGMSGGVGSAYDIGATATPPPVSADPERTPAPAVAPSSAPHNDFSADTVSTDDRTAPIRSVPYGSSIGAAPPVKYSYEGKKFCTFKVSFSSRGAGVDRKTAESVKSFLESRSQKLSYKRVDWGHEGEYDYCVDVPRHSDRASVYAGIKRLIPKKSVLSDSTGDTLLAGSGFETITTQK